MKVRLYPSRFSQRILLGFSLLLLLFLGVMIAVELWGLPGTATQGRSADCRAHTLRDMERVSGILGQRLSDWCRESRQDVEGLMSSPCIRQRLEDPRLSADSGLAGELDAFRMSHPGCLSLALLDPGDARILAASGGFADAAPIGGIDAGRLAKLSAPGYLETLELHSAADRLPYLRICRQAVSPDDEKVLALLVAEWDVGHAVRALRGSADSILNRDWECVVAGPSSGEAAAFEPVRLALSGIKGPYDGPDAQGGAILAFYRPIKIDRDIALALVLKTGRALALRPARGELLRQGALWLALFLAGIVLCLFLARQISRPVNGLVAVARRIKAGDLSGRAAAGDGSEIGQFAAVFNGMLDRLQAAQQELEKQVQDRTRELRVLSARQEAILTAVPEIIVEVDENKAYTWSNRAGFEFFGKELIGKEAAFFFAGEQDTYKRVQPLFDGAGVVLYIESWQRRKDGAVRLLAWWCRALKDAQGQMTRVISTARDITDQKLAEEALKQKCAELERFNQLTADREVRMIELKREINGLLRAAGQPEKYRIVTERG